MRELISRLLSGILKEKEEIILNLIESPPNQEFGDYSLPCFFLSKKLKKNPNEIASEFAKKIPSKREIEKVEAKGPYINFFIDKNYLAEETIKKILKEKDKYGFSDMGKNKKVVIEFSSPNIAKPFGIGHLRSTIIGNAIANLYSYSGFKPVRINFLGDWGTPFGKIIAGYKKFGSKEKLKKDPIKHLFDVYVKASNSESLDSEAREWFKKMELGDKEAVLIWKNFKALSLKEFDRIYKMLGIKFDSISGESDYNKKSEEVINLLKKNNLLKKSDGALIVDLEKESLGVSLIKKSDGTTLYSTRDIAAAIDRHKKYKFEEMIYEVGSEQALHFKQVFKILELIGFDWAKNCRHVSHGLYLGKDGKKFASRKGKTIFMEDVIKETKELVTKEILKRENKISSSELEKRTLAITLSAIFYGDLKNFLANDVVFDIERFLSFEGNTGPYLLYTHARAKSIIKKAKLQKKFTLPKNISEKEKSLILHLSKFPEIIQKSRKEIAPNVVANYAHILAQLFNEFYHSEKVLGSKEQAFKLALVNASAQTLKNSLSILGIPVLERM